MTPLPAPFWHLGGKHVENDNGYYPVTLSCGHEVWGTDADIDSGLRKHKDYCDYYIDEMDGTETEL